MRQRSDRQPRAGEIYIEYKVVGNAVRVVAVDAKTGVEVTVIGPKSAAKPDLERLVVAKLRRRIEQTGN